MLPYFRLLLLLSSLSPIQAQERTFTRPQLQADLAHLQAALKRYQPNLYLYTAESDYERFFDSLNRQLPENMDDLAFYAYLTPLCSKIKDGHTLFYPNANTTAYHNAHSKFFPFKTYWNGSKMYVELNFSATDVIENGAEILRINGVPAEQVMRFCIDRMMRDGHNENYPIWVLNNWFNEYYSYFYGHPDTFDIQYRDRAGQEQTRTVKALDKTAIWDNRKARYPNRVFTRSFDVKKGDGITLKIDTATKTAILTIKDFDKGILKKAYGQSFKKTIKGYMAQTKQSGATTLILDLRNNQGGDLEHGKYLLSYLLREPFTIIDSYAKVAHPEQSIEAERNKAAKGAALGTVQPKADAFKGTLYLLVNGGSFSNSGIVSSAIQHYKRGTILGEETGGNRCVLSAAEKTVTLPNTGIKIYVPKLQFNIREKAQNNGHGVVPDVSIKPNIRQLIAGKDEVLGYVLGLRGN